MNTNMMKLLDNDDLVVATLDVEDREKYYRGTINLDRTPDDRKQLFAEFESLVSDQCFSLVDDVQDKIEARCSRVQLQDDTIIAIHDLQVCPSNGRVSLQLKQPLTIHQNGTPHEHRSIERPVR